MLRDCRQSAALRSPLAAALSKAGRALPAGSTAAAAAGHVEGKDTLQNVAASLDCCDAAIGRGQHASSGLLLACCASRQHARRMAISRIRQREATKGSVSMMLKPCAGGPGQPTFRYPIQGQLEGVNAKFQREGTGARDCLSLIFAE